MSWNVDSKEVERLGDWDFVACLAYNPQEEFKVSGVKEILATYEGSRDNESWFWICELDDGRFVGIKAWCDFTGWACRSSTNLQIVSTKEDALKTSLTIPPDEGERWEPENVYKYLKKQIDNGKRKKTRREIVGEELFRENFND